MCVRHKEGRKEEAWQSLTKTKTYIYIHNEDHISTYQLNIKELLDNYFMYVETNIASSFRAVTEEDVH